MRPSSQPKRAAALAAAERQFLATGYESVTMDSIAQESGVAKQTLYSHFGSKRDLFLEIVRAQTESASASVLEPAPRFPDASRARDGLHELLVAQLGAVLAPRILALRRLVIGELRRSPELAAALYELGPRRAILALTAVVTELDAAGVIRADDAERAATQLNWLVMGEPINRAMLLGDAAALAPELIPAHVDAALDTFFAAYGAAERARP
ncbi:TetR/AcrR family transcriptional regulator [uncultured Microbacterium sp.]|uniref:TetR/AcrR family transcriptional regulator n=1 Tax=uncultured Microbacterium sp. TaxID=191216 RepID=UPI0025D42256|nr:TetR/AcrR family transcriptional regulator [uncultured Microbacterium sp.]MBS1899991.1 TetR/AcrR family transcriptional regulator [Actinomycetota bacterium]